MDMEDFLTRRQVASRWGVSVATIDRLRKAGLPWIRLAVGGNNNSVVRFRLADIEAYESERTRTVRGDDDM